MKILLALILALVACKKQEDAPPAAKAPPAAPAAPASTTADHVTVLAHHHHPKPTDPVRVELARFRVVKAAFDPAKLDGGTATIELDLASLRTGSDERDDHLKSPSYLDIGKFATVTIDVDHVKQQAGDTYTADAHVTAHGMDHTYPVTFSVLSRHDKTIQIRAEQPFTRLDFGIGTDPAQNTQEQVGTDLTIEMVLTLASA